MMSENADKSSIGDIPLGRTENFPLESFKRVEEFIGHLRREAMERAGRYASAMTPQSETEVIVGYEHIDMGLEFALRNPSGPIIDMIRKDNAA